MAKKRLFSPPLLWSTTLTLFKVTFKMLFTQKHHFYVIGGHEDRILARKETFPSWMKVPKFVGLVARIHPMLVDKTDLDFAFKMA